MRHLSLSVAFLASSACVYSACLFPEIVYLDEDATAGNGGGGTGAAPATTGGMGGGVGGDTTTTGGGGSGGTPLDCEAANLGVEGLCSNGQKCTVLDASTGEVGCALAGSKADWDTCGSDADCGDGSWCDLVRNVCKPFCRNVDDCADTDGECLPAPQSGGMEDIPGGVKTCISMCNPLSASPCQTSNVTCMLIGNNQFDCAQSGNVTLANSCTEQADCAAGHACITSIVGTQCERYCSPIGSSPSECSVINCESIDTPEITWMGMAIGTCF